MRASLKQDKGHAGDNPSSVELPRGADCEFDHAAWRQGAFAQAKAAKLSPVEYVRGGSRDRRNVGRFLSAENSLPKFCGLFALRLEAYDGTPDDSEADEAIRQTVDWGRRSGR